MNPEVFNFPARLDGRYLLQVPEAAAEDPLLILALHGYGANPEVMLRLTTGMVSNRHVIASLQAPNQHYATPGEPGRSEAAYNWGIRQHWESSVRLHHQMVSDVLASLRAKFHAGPERCLLVGFSQPVSLNYRFAATYPSQVRGCIGICGGVPGDWREAKYGRVTASILHIAREDDEFYPREVVLGFSDRLRERAADVEFHLIPGRHRFPSKADSIVEPWLQRVFGSPPG